MKSLAAIFLIILMISAPVSAFAEAGDQDAAAPIKSGDTAAQDTKNALLGWTEIPKAIVQVTNESKNPLTGLTRGTLTGIMKAFSKTVSGMAGVAAPSMRDTGRP